MKRITATVVYPVNIAVEVDEKASTDEIWQVIVDSADDEMRSSGGPVPVIYECSEPDLIHKDAPKVDKKPESQSEIFQVALDSIRTAQTAMAPLVRYTQFLAGIKNKRGEHLDTKINQLSAALKFLMDDLISAISPKVTSEKRKPSTRRR